MGAALLLLALGSFHPYAPWSLLHRLPVFRSQHVPMRWLYPALLPFLCLAASSGESLLRRAWRGRLVIEGVLVLGVAWMAYDIGAIARLPLVSAFSVARPIVPELVADFHTERRLPEALDYHARSAWPLSLPAEMINMGTIACNTFPGLAQSRRDDHDHAPGLGARGSADPDYLGEVYVADGHGTARVVRWTPNEVDVRVDGAAPGAFVVLNQNWDPGWRADGEPALDYADTVAAPVTSPDPIVHFAYRPRTWAASLVALGLTLGAMVAARQWSRRCDG
jgi:hypothetical protein